MNGFAPIKAERRLLPRTQSSGVGHKWRGWQRIFLGVNRTPLERAGGEPPGIPQSQDALPVPTDTSVESDMCDIAGHDRRWYPPCPAL